MEYLITVLSTIVIILLGIVLYNQSKTKSLIRETRRKIMSALTQAELDLAAKFDVAANAIKTEIEDILANGGTVDELNAAFQPVLDKLTALGVPTPAKPAGV